MGSVWRWLTDPHIGDRLLRDEDEDIVDVVHKHWIVYVVPAVTEKMTWLPSEQESSFEATTVRGHDEPVKIVK